MNVQYEIAINNYQSKPKFKANSLIRCIPHKSNLDLMQLNPMPENRASWLLLMGGIADYGISAKEAISRWIYNSNLIK